MNKENFHECSVAFLTYIKLFNNLILRHFPRLLKLALKSFTVTGEFKYKTRLFYSVLNVS